jgi:hypothetical protein
MGGECSQDFKDSFEKSALHVFKQLQATEKTAEKREEIEYMQALVLLVQGFFRCFEEREQLMRSILKGYFTGKGEEDYIELEEVRAWLEKNGANVLNNILYNQLKDFCHSN